MWKGYLTGSDGFVKSDDGFVKKSFMVLWKRDFIGI